MLKVSCCAVLLLIGIVTTGPIAVGQELTPDELLEMAAGARAADSSAQLPPPANRDFRSMTTLYFSDFEGDDGGLSGSRDWEWGEYSWPGTTTCFGVESHPSAPFSGGRMWGTVLNDCYSDLANNEDWDSCTNNILDDDSILSLTVDLTSTTTAWLSWAEWNDVLLPFDWVEIRVDGVIIDQVCGGEFEAPDQWVVKALDISAVAGRVVTLDFHMMASSIINRSGWYIDDLAVTDDFPLHLFVDGFESGDTSMWSVIQPG